MAETPAETAYVGHRHRRSKYNPARVETICRALRAGNTRKNSAAYAEIDYDTFIQWMRRYPAFRGSVLKAEADVEAMMVQRVAIAARNGDAKAAQWWLERRRYADWKEQKELVLSSDPERPVLHEVTVGAGSSLARLAELAEAMDVLVRVGSVPRLVGSGEGSD